MTDIDFDIATRGLKNLEAGLLNAAGHAAIATDLDGYVIYWNAAAEKLYGWTRAEVLGRNILDITPTSQSSIQAASILHELTRGGTWIGEFEARHKDGRWFTVQVTDAPVYDEAGNHVAIVGLSVEVEAPKSGVSLLRGALETAIRAITARFGAPVPEAGPRPLHGVLGNRFLEFALALVIFAAAVVMRMGLDYVVPGRLPFITFIPAVLLTSFLCGLWPSIAVVLASAVASAVWSEPPAGTERAFMAWAFVLTALVGAAIMLLVFHLLNVQDRLQRQDAQLSLINRELKHRLKNLLTVTSSICLQTFRSAATREEVPKLISGRIQAIAAAQDLLSITADRGSDLRALIDALVRPMAPQPSRLKIDGPAVMLPAETTTPFALILQELATNALKYGAWSSPRGQVVITCAIRDGALVFGWRERDGAPVAPAMRQGVGSLLIKRGLNRATVSHELKPAGLECEIVLPL